MSLSESYRDLPAYSPPAADVPPVDPVVQRLRTALDGLLEIAGEEHPQGAHQSQRVYIFRGKLQAAPGPAYTTLSERFKPIGYTPMLRRDHEEDTVVALEGTLVQSRVQTRWWLHLLLLLVTLATTAVMGATVTGFPADTTIRALRTLDWPVLWPALRDGLPFSLTLLAILGVHEMGHYVAARLHGAKVTLPFFIPLPVSGTLGTLGAVIFIRSPLMNRRALFDVGIAGPLAGMVIAIPAFLIGLHQPQTIGLPDTWMDAGILRVANPPLLDWLAPLAVHTHNLDRFVFFGHPMALAAWFGVLLTSLNLLPMGQFDGGHVMYALLGRRAWTLARFVFVGLLLLGVFGFWFTWLIWAMMGLLTGLRHPPPHDDLTPLGWPRTLIGIATVILFTLIFVPIPFYAP